MSAAPTVTSTSDAAPSPPLRIAFLGPLGTYSHQAATEFFGNESELVPVARISDVFASVERRECEFGVVPIENSSFGPVIETANELRTTTTSVRGMIQLKIGHALLSKRGVAATDEGKQSMKRVYSHEQGIGQCRKYISERYPQAKVVPVNSTAKAAQEAVNDPSGLAICSLKCAEVYDLDVVDTDIQDAGFSNTTRFIALSLPHVTMDSRYPIQASIRTDSQIVNNSN
ncbi:prephenate dehydratase PHA2 [Sporobolomyces koalae]|uniref:prephenate dehydratase PHA2 n=1 Tax=Sporobolomyces koalae TaxID=500713 RepID=UPI003178496B